MALILLPFFMPLLLLGWILPRDERRERALEARREQEFGETWAVLYATESQVMQLPPGW
jgi:hypothetical protein